ncbi:MAG: sulfatase [Planctomycetota bacterium]
MAIPRKVLAAFLPAVVVVATGPTAGANADSLPDLVVVIADDHGVGHSSVYGAADQRTPNMQALADDGMTFSRAYVASPSCAPSRFALITAMAPHRNGVVGNHEHRFFKHDECENLIRHLLDAGYEVVFKGKIIHGRTAAAQPSDVVVLPGAAKLMDLGNVEDYLRDRPAPERPLALFVGPTDTHTVWTTEPDLDRFRPADLDLPPKTFDTPEARRLMARYNHAVSDVDVRLGRVRELAEKYLDPENTLTLYTSDHGQNWPFGKWSLYETGVRTPLIVSWPGRIAPGSTTDAMVSWIDLLPTLLDVAGAPAAAGVDGRSFKDVLLGDAREHRDKIFTVHKGDKDTNVYPCRAVRTDRWKYIVNLFPEFKNTTHMDVEIFPPSHVKAGERNVHFFAEAWPAWEGAGRTDERAARFLHRYHARPAEELYAVEDDPFEERNLAFDPAFGEVLKTMRRLVRDRMREVGDDRSLSGEPRRLAEEPLPPAIELYYPNGGETLADGGEVTIRWSTFWGGAEAVDIEYGDDGDWHAVAEGVPHSGAFVWRLPDDAGGAVRLRISSADGAVRDVSDGLIEFK